MLLYMLLVCCPDLRRSYPTNYILLGLLTLCMSFTTGVYTVYYTTQSVMVAGAICTVTSIGIAVVATNTKYDITGFLGVMNVFLFALILFGLSLFFWKAPWATKMYSGLGAVLFMLYLAIDIQMIMGNRKLELQPEEYIFAALMIYVDIVTLFMRILALTGERRNR